MTNSNFTPAFEIFKEGRTTNGFITILKEVGKPYDTTKKVAFYKSLGYTVRNIKP